MKLHMSAESFANSKNYWLDKWLPKPLNNSTADIPELYPSRRTKLYCLPYAGGGASTFRQWPDLIRSAETRAIRLPGREARIKEPAFVNLDQLVRVLVEVISEDAAGSPFAIFGHSMGAILAYEIVMQLDALQLPQASLLILSARKAPIFDTDYYRQVKNMSDHEFIQELVNLSPNSKHLVDNPTLRKMMLPTVRADFELCSDWTPNLSEKIPTNILALGGTQDETTSLESVQAWHSHCSRDFKFSSVDGGHFFINECSEEVCRLIDQQLSEIKCCQSRGSK